MTWLLVALGAAVGAPARYLADRVVQRRRPGRRPLGTALVNVAGSLVLGVVAGATAGAGDDGVQALIGTGFCGALTTYSTLGYEVVRLAADGDRPGAWWTLAGSTAAGIMAAAVGWILGGALA